MAVDSFNGRTGAVVSVGTDYGWTVSASNVNFALSGNVGIGTTSPAVLMDLKGNNVAWGGQLRLQATDFAQISFYNSSSPTLSSANRKGDIYYDFSGSALVLENWNGGSYGATIINPSGGNVGIGTSAPAVLMDLKGNNVGWGGQLRLQATDYAQISFYNSSSSALSGANRKGDIYYDISGSTLVLENWNGGSYGGTIINPSGGNVGIGTNTPSHRLDVAGNVGLSSAAHINFGSADGAAGFGFRDSGGAVQTKNSGQSDWTDVQQSLNVKSFGATGTSNDTAVFQAAFNAASNSELYIPAGTYLIDPISISNLPNVTIRGAGRGATIIRMRSGTASVVMITATNCNNLTIRDLTLDGNYPNTSGIAAVLINTSLAPTVTGIEATGCGPQTGSISLFGCTNAMVRGCHVYGPTTGSNNSHGIALSNCAQCIVAENATEQQANSGIQIFFSQGISITGNVCSTTVETSGAGFGGIRLADDCYSCSVTGNTINGYGRGIFLVGVIYTTVSGNTVRSCNYEGILVAASTVGSAMNTNYNIISNNAIHNPCEVGADGGIVLSKEATTNCSGNIVIGNTIIDSRSPARITKALINGTGDATNKFPADTNTTNISTLGP